MTSINFFTRLFSEPLVVDSSNGGFYFDLFYLMAFVFATVWMLWEGHKRKINWVSWLLVLAFTRLAFIVGTKIISYTPSDWSYALTHLESWVSVHFWSQSDWSEFPSVVWMHWQLQSPFL
jgi:hypothetical protein